MVSRWLVLVALAVSVLWPTGGSGAVPPVETPVPVAATPQSVDPDNVATFGEPKGERGGMCPDGGFITLALYDPDPSDPNAVVYLFKRGDVPVALRVAIGDSDRLYVYAAHRWFTIDEAKATWPSPCDIPTVGR